MLIVEVERSHDDPKLTNDSGKVPKSNPMVASLIPSCEISFLPHANLA